MKKIWIISCASLVFLFSILAFYLIVQAKEKPAVAVIMKRSDTQYWKVMRAGIVKAAMNVNVNEKIYVPAKDDENQIKLLKKVLKEKPDAIIAALANPADAIPILQEYKKAGIPVLLVDTEADWPDQTAFIGTDNHALGRLAGELLSTTLQPGDQAALIGKYDHNSISTERIEGAKAALHASGIEVAADQVIDLKSENFRSAFKKIIKKNPDLKGVFVTNDELAVEILKYSSQKKLKLQVVGSDGMIEMIQQIKSGTIKSTLAQNPYDIGYLSMESAVKAINGKKVENRINSGVDIITKDNANSKLEFLKTTLFEY